jgi:hypothetical protein
MFISVRNSPLTAPVFTSNEASWAEIRDEQGYLVLAIIFPLGKQTCLVLDHRSPDFEETIRGFGIPQHVNLPS